MTSTAALTTVLNPADQSEIQLFYLGPNGDLNMVDQALQKPDGDTTEGLEMKSSSSNPPGMLVSPSSLTSVVVKKKVEVWGISVANQQVVRVSPAIQYLPQANTTGNTHSIAGASNGKARWLYYLKSTPNGTRLGEFLVGKGPLNKLTIAPLRATSLGATWVGPGPQNRLVFYQDEGNLLHAVNPEGPSDNNIQGTSNARPSTPLAAVTLPSKKVVIYYIDSNSHIFRSIRDGEKWGAIVQVKSEDVEPILSSLSGLAATVADGYVRLTYVSEATGSARYETFDDELA